MKSPRLVILDLPVPLDPVEVDLSLPLESQLPKGPYLDAAKKMLARAEKIAEVA